MMLHKTCHLGFHRSPFVVAAGVIVIVVAVAIAVIVVVILVATDVTAAIVNTVAILAIVVDT